MFKKLMLVVAVVAVMAGVGGTVAFADDVDGCPLIYNEDEGVYVAGICDGRINAFDLTQSAAVYYTYTSVPTVNEIIDEDGSVTYENSSTDVVSGVDIWVVSDDSTGQRALFVPVETINAAIAGGVDTVIAQGSGVALNYSAWGALWIAAPHGYTFTWEPAW